MTQLLSSGKFCKLYLLKVHLQTFLSKPITQKCQILSCDSVLDISCISTVVQTLQRKVHVNISTVQDCINKVGLQRYDCFGHVMLG